jgi:1,4-alpha-glucan branching enzyme
MMEKIPEGRSSLVIHPEWSRDAVIYEVNIRQYTPEGTFAAFEKHLPRLKEMGVGILWLMPVNPIGIVNRKGSLGSYYSIRDFLGVNPEFGSLDDLKRLIDNAHGLGMKVIIDWVADHSSWDNPMTSEHPDWYLQDQNGNIISPAPDWTDVAGFDYNQPGIREYMTNAFIWWIKNADIDGFRCDVANMLPVGFWNEAIPEVQKVKHVLMLAEAEEPEMHDNAFDITYCFDLYHLMNDIAAGKANAERIDVIWEKEASLFNPDAYRLQFTSNHDENSWNGTEYERLGDAAAVMAVLTFTVPGIPLIYSGQEASLKKRLQFFDKDVIDWDHIDLAGFYRKLTALKKGHKALWNGKAGGTFSKVKTTNDNAIYSFIRETENDKVFVVLNLSPNPQHIRFIGDGYAGQYSDIFSGETIIIIVTNSLDLKPWEYRVMVQIDKFSLEHLQ